jgi:hypothetical protein
VVISGSIISSLKLRLDSPWEKKREKEKQGKGRGRTKNLLA